MRGCHNKMHNPARISLFRTPQAHSNEVSLSSRYCLRGIAPVVPGGQLNNTHPARSTNSSGGCSHRLLYVKVQELVRILAKNKTKKKKKRRKLWYLRDL